MANNSNKEPDSAPLPDNWYDLTLGPSFTQNNSSKFCTLRYEFLPASIDKNQAGTLHKKDNRVTVEFHNNQQGKPKVTFEGTSEDCKDNDAVLFFDGQSFRLERLHRAVKRLRHVRLPGESAAAAALPVSSSIGAAAAAVDPLARSPLVGKSAKPSPAGSLVSKSLIHSVPVEVERIDVGDIPSSGSKAREKSPIDKMAQPQPTFSPVPRSYETEKIDVVADDDDDEDDIARKTTMEELFGVDINVPPGNEDERSDDDEDDIAVDIIDDYDEDRVPNAVEAGPAETTKEQESDGQTSSSSSSSGSGSSRSGSGSGSSSSDSEGSENDSITSI